MGGVCDTITIVTAKIDHHNKYNNNENVCKIVRIIKMQHITEQMLIEKMAPVELVEIDKFVVVVVLIGERLFYNIVLLSVAKQCK